jgi:alpha-tubulin suppressor-like RCC1 family protein
LRSALGLAAMWLAAALAGCGDSGPADNNDANGNQNVNPPVCGNGAVELGEECDEGSANSDVAPGACRTTCRNAHCGDGVIDAGETCDGSALEVSTCEGLGQGYTGGVLRCGSDCNLDTSRCATCGNAEREEGEQCDGADVGAATCAGLVGLQQGVVLCTTGCIYDTGECHTCGNATVEGAEACEGEDVGGATCEQLGYLWGALRCDPDACRFDTTGCHSECGNGVVEPGEECDGWDLALTTCPDLGFLGGTLGCTAACRFDARRCSRCGDGVVDPGEACDGDAFAGQTCASLTGGAMTGSLQCGSDCQLDTLGCEPPASCGNGAVDDGEQCDGGALGTVSCQVLDPERFGGGALSCQANCLYDRTACVEARPCGDGVREPEAGEACDGNDLGGQTCVALGFRGGFLRCDAWCAFDPGDCLAPLTCGDGVRVPGEACDGADLDGQTCATLGYRGGTLACAANCAFDTGGCLTCGDDVRNGTEACDGVDLAGQSCETLGFLGGGTLGCDGACQYDLSACATYCGDGVKDPTEQCDQVDFGGDSCAARGYYSGSLTCSLGCEQIDATACTGRCGDDVLQASQGEECDGNEFGGDSCAARGFYAGSLDCTPGCAIDATYCLYSCGDGVVSSTYGEVCDGSNTGTDSCSARGYAGGVLGCSADCRSTTAVGCVHWAHVEAGGYHTCGITAGDSQIWCWGQNYSGQLGDNTKVDKSLPVRVHGPGNVGYLDETGVFTAITPAYRHTCALREDGTVWCWGANTSGQLGTNSVTESLTPTQVQAVGGTGVLTDVVQLAAHSGFLGEPNGFNCARRSDLTLWCWGENSYGQVGDGAPGVNRLLPAAVKGPGGVGTLTDVVDVDAGTIDVCAVKGNGTVFCWGSNYKGELGDNSSTQRPYPTQVLGPGGVGTLDSVTAVMLSNGSSCALRVDGTVWCWGNNSNGQLGDGTTTDRWVPVQVVGSGATGFLSGVNTLASGAGSLHFCVVDDNGTAWCWGAGPALGNGSVAESHSPVIVGNGFHTGVGLVSIGFSYTCGVRSDGTAWCWGLHGATIDDYGQLGNDGFVSSTFPVPVLGQVP